MKKIKVYKVGYGLKKYNIVFYKKVFILTFLFISLITILNVNFDKLTTFLSDISQYGKGLISPKKIELNLEKIENIYLIWPFKEVTNWGIIDSFGYQKAKFTVWNKLPEKYKTFFPQKVVDIMEEYKYIPPSQIRSYISNPDLREKLLFYKRLFTTSWTAGYRCDKDVCLWWVPDSGTHGGQDIVTSIDTPVRSISTGIVIQKKFDPKGFGNYLIVAFVIDGKVYSVLYGHLDKFADDIKEGDIIKQGQIIGFVGKTGITNGTPHLHFQINKIGSIKEIKGKGFNWLKERVFYKNDLKWLKENTVNPMVFVENHLSSNLTSLQVVHGYKAAVFEQNKEILSGNNEIKNISSKPFRLIKIINPKISGRLTVGDEIIVKLITTGTKGNIVLSTKNNLLKLSSYSIIPISGKNIYEIKIIAVKPGNEQLFISDGLNTKVLYFSIYPKKQRFLQFIKIEGPKQLIYSYPQKYRILSVDNLGNIGIIKLNGKLQVSLLSSGKLLYSKIYYVNSQQPYIDFNLKSPKFSGDLILKVKFWTIDGKLFIAKKKLKSDIFFDYSINDKYGIQLADLLKRGIVLGDSGFLYPNNQLTKAQLVAILLRYRFGNKYDEWKKEYENYLRNNKENIFKDLTIDNFWAPYVFKAKQIGLLKGYNGFSFWNKSVNLFELIMIYGRFFKVKSDDPYVIWANLPDDKEFVYYIKAAKKYNLYPFDDLFDFKKNGKVTRLKAFVSLYRYIHFKPSKVLGVVDTKVFGSAETSDESKKKLKELVETLLK